MRFSELLKTRFVTELYSFKLKNGKNTMNFIYNYSLQGAILTLPYCFFNSEVQGVIKLHWNRSNKILKVKWKKVCNPSLKRPIYFHFGFIEMLDAIHQDTINIDINLLTNPI